MKRIQGLLLSGLACAALLAPPASWGFTGQQKANFSTPPTATIAHWRNSAPAAYSIIHDDVCDGALLPSPRGTYGLFQHWREAANRGVRIALGAIGSACVDQDSSLAFLRQTLASGYELASHSYYHCDHTREPSACTIWSAAANGGAGGPVPLTSVFPEIDTRQKLLDFEMAQSRFLFGNPNYTAAPPTFYTFPSDRFDTLALSRLAGAGYLGARGGNRATGNINAWNINPDPSQGGNALVDYQVLFDVYNASDTPGNPANVSSYPPPSLANYLNAVLSGGAGGWGVQVLHGIADASFGTVALETYTGHLDSLAALQDQNQLWVATPTEAIKYRRTHYHCGGARGGNPAAVTVEPGGNLVFAGLADPLCPVYATEVTVVITLPAGIPAITATQAGLPLGVRAGGAGKVMLSANPTLGTINIQPAAGAAAPSITSASGATFTVNVPASFTVTATGTPAPRFFSNGALPAGLTLNASTGVIGGTPMAAGTFVRTLVAGNGAGPDATQTFTLTIHKGNQAISFVPIPFLNVGTVEGVFAGATSGLPLVFQSLTPDTCAVSNATLTVTGFAPGTCTIAASQAGDVNWNPASATLSFFVKSTQDLSLAMPASLAVGGSGVVTASASSGLPVTLTTWNAQVCTLSGNVVTAHATGICTIAANQEGSDIYYPAAQFTRSVLVDKGSQAIAFGPAPTLTVGAVGTLSATASSGLAVTFSSLTSGTCSVSGSLVTGVGIGTCRVAANQAGNENYLAAPQVTQSFAVGPAVGAYGLQVLLFGDAGGTVVSTPAGIDCGTTCSANFAAGQTVTLTATASTEAMFTGWGGACSGLGPCTVTMNGAKTVGANFHRYTSVSRLSGISTRAKVMGGHDVVIGGFIVGGNTPKTVVVRGIGPSLTGHGVAGALVDPKLELVAGGAVIASNDNWTAAANAFAVEASGLAPSDPREAAIHVTLDPGAYTAILSGVGGATGIGLVEVYEVHPQQAPLDGISTRANLQEGDGAVIGGFVIQGPLPKKVIVRARGPSLTSAGVANALGNPALQLFSGSTLIASNGDWQAAANAGDIAASGAAPGHPAEAAILITLNPGVYTAVVSGGFRETGIVIVEVFTQ